jgi:hypothetical protein
MFTPEDGFSDHGAAVCTWSVISEIQAAARSTSSIRRNR